MMLLGRRSWSAGRSRDDFGRRVYGGRSGSAKFDDIVDAFFDGVESIGNALKRLADLCLVTAVVSCGKQIVALAAYRSVRYVLHRIERSHAEALFQTEHVFRLGSRVCNRHFEGYAAGLEAAGTPSSG